MLKIPDLDFSVLVEEAFIDGKYCIQLDARLGYKIVLDGFGIVWDFPDPYYGDVCISGISLYLKNNNTFTFTQNGKKYELSVQWEELNRLKGTYFYEWYECDNDTLTLVSNSDNYQEKDPNLLINVIYCPDDDLRFCQSTSFFINNKEFDPSLIKNINNPIRCNVKNGVNYLLINSVITYSYFSHHKLGISALLNGEYIDLVRHNGEYTFSLTITDELFDQTLSFVLIDENVDCLEYRDEYVIEIKNVECELIQEELLSQDIIIKLNTHQYSVSVTFNGEDICTNDYKFRALYSGCYIVIIGNEKVFTFDLSIKSELLYKLDQYCVIDNGLYTYNAGYNNGVQKIDFKIVNSIEKEYVVLINDEITKIDVINGSFTIEVDTKEARLYNMVVRVDDMVSTINLLYISVSNISIESCSIPYKNGVLLNKGAILNGNVDIVPSMDVTYVWRDDLGIQTKPEYVLTNKTSLVMCAYVSYKSIIEAYLDYNVAKPPWQILSLLKLSVQSPIYYITDFTFTSYKINDIEKKYGEKIYKFAYGETINYSQNVETEYDLLADYMTISMDVSNGVSYYSIEPIIIKNDDKYVISGTINVKESGLSITESWKIRTLYRIEIGDCIKSSVSNVTLYQTESKLYVNGSMLNDTDTITCNNKRLILGALIDMQEYNEDATVNGFIGDVALEEKKVKLYNGATQIIYGKVMIEEYPVIYKINIVSGDITDTIQVTIN